MNNNIESVEVFLVEDNETDIELIKEALKLSRLSTSLKIANDGEEAIDYLTDNCEKMESQKPDIILLDLNLPKKDGIEVLSFIKNNNRIKDIPVIVLTVSGCNNDVLKAYSHHANCYIRKPVDFDKFEEIVRQIETFWFSIVSLPRKEMA
ncbi:MAG: response regulator [Candidatus Kapaibacterium sp.]